MKKIFMLLTALLTYCGGAVAEDGLAVQDVNISQGGEATLEITLENATTAFAAFQFNVQLVDGITVVTNDKGKFVYEKGARLDEDFTLSVSKLEEPNMYRALGYYTEKQAIPGTNGAIVKLTIKADAALAIGSTYECKLTGINLTEPDETKHTPDDISFNVKVVEKAYTILDETSTTVPTASDGEVDIKVKRTINANEWSTIVLPFDMTEEQVKSVFGNDVKLAEFVDYEADYDEDDNVTGLAVNFKNVDLSEGFYANYPYLIKVTSDITEFDVTAEIDPDEESAVTEYDNDKKGKQREVYGSFIGTYHAGDYIPANDLFLSGNKFYYSVGKTKIKAFRAYLWLDDMLTSGSGEAPVRIAINDETTRIADIEKDQILDGVYTLQGVALGQKDVQSLPKGIYIVNGKKVSVK
ncbi:MAG: hypothetical protein IJV33_08765 [Bacteroidaceae bacterium]|nr:hypothetical protein [Bacteroidaceae bacterium]